MSLGSQVLRRAFVSVKRKGLKTIRAYEEELIAYLHKELCTSEEIQIYGPAEMKEKVGIFAFNIKKEWAASRQRRF